MPQPKPIKQHKPRLLWGILILLTAFLCFWQLGAPELTRWDESTNALVIWDTAEQGTFPLLRFGSSDFLEKPPLWYWATTLISELLGWGPTSLRLLTATSGFLVILLTAYLGRKWFSSRVGWLTGMILLASGQLFVLNPDLALAPIATHTFRTADGDALLLLLSVAAVWTFEAGRDRPWSLYLGAVLTGLAVLTKGPLGLLPLFILGLYYLYRPAARPTLGTLLKAVAVLLLVTLPWHVAMVIHSGQAFLEGYLGYHLLSRATSAIEGHSGPPWFYLQLLLSPKFFALGPLALLGMLTLARRARQQTLAYGPFAVLVGGALGLLLPSLMGTKLAWYLLPAFPFLAVAASSWIIQSTAHLGRPIRQILGLILSCWLIGLTISSVIKIDRASSTLFPDDIIGRARECQSVLPAQEERLLRYYALRLSAYTSKASDRPCQLAFDPFERPILERY